MKNNNNNQQRPAERRGYISAYTDMLVNPEVVEMNQQKLQNKPARRKRRINYDKKIMNDPLVFNA